MDPEGSSNGINQGQESLIWEELAPISVAKRL